MGPAIAGAAAVWALGRRPATRVVLMGAVAVALALMTAAVRASSWLGVLPDPLEWYLRPTPGRTNFTLLPWAGFVFGGAAVGVLLELARERDAEKRLIAQLAIAGAAIGLASYAASFLPSLFGPSQFWTSSPAFFFIRVSLMIAALALAFLWEQRRGAARFSPLRQFGRTSLFIYWIHIEMVYGVLTRPIQQALPLWQSIIAYAIFTALMLAASLLKDRFAGWWTLRRKRSATPATIPAGGIT
jgi:surface polysaccharide O-acyltransferase-like enzyme